MEAAAQPAQRAANEGASDSLIAPPVLENRSRAPQTVEVTLTASRTKLSLLAGSATDVFAYNGRVPGPTLEVRAAECR